MWLSWDNSTIWIFAFGCSSYIMLYSLLPWLVYNKVDMWLYNMFLVLGSVSTPGMSFFISFSSHRMYKASNLSSCYFRPFVINFNAWLHCPHSRMYVLSIFDINWYPAIDSWKVIILNVFEQFNCIPLI